MATVTSARIAKSTANQLKKNNMPEIEVQMKIDPNGNISFFGESGQVDIAIRIYNRKLDEARAQGRNKVIQNIVSAVEKFVSSV